MLFNAYTRLETLYYMKVAIFIKRKTSIYEIKTLSPVNSNTD